MSDKELILLVDDDATNLDVLVNSLDQLYKLGIAKTGEKAIDFVQKKNPDLILLDINMPGMDGYEVCQKLKSDPETKDIPIIFLTALTEVDAKNKGFEVGAVDYITKPFNSIEVKQRVKAHLSTKKVYDLISNQNVILEKEVEEKTAEIENMLEGVVDAMALTVETRDPYTAGHQQRVASIGMAIAQKMGLSKFQLKTIRYAGTLHDIGKIFVPVSILSKPGKLFVEEFGLIKRHSQVGYDILKIIPTPWPIAQVVHQHHECINGSGYPLGLTEKDILIESKILTVADVTEAMGTHRPYRPALGIDVAIEEIDKNKGIKYDAEVVKACKDLFLKDGWWGAHFG